MEVWTHGASIVYHPFDERRVDIDTNTVSIRPGTDNQPAVVDSWFNFQHPLVEQDVPSAGWALSAVLVRLRTWDDKIGLKWVSAYDREYRILRVRRDTPLASPGNYRVLRFERPGPRTPYQLDPPIGGPVCVGLRVAGSSLANISAVGLALRPSINYWPGTKTWPGSQIPVTEEMSTADYREALTIQAGSDSDFGQSEVAGQRGAEA